jgi:hypothetical protein
MAKRKKTKYRSRRRRMGAIGSAKGAATTALGIVAGAIAAKFVVKQFPQVNDKIKNAGVLALGVFLPKFAKGDFMKAVGHGMIATGGVGLASQFLPAIAGMDDSIEFPVTVGEVPDNLSVIAGDDGNVMAGDDLQVLAGIEDDEDGE